MSKENLTEFSYLHTGMNEGMDGKTFFQEQLRSGFPGRACGSDDENGWFHEMTPPKKE
jgi:hypothetical protein